MPEIDPQPEARLTEALRRLGASSCQSAPPEIGAGLLDEFRRHHARRRMIRRTAILALTACIALAVGLFTLRKPQSQRTNAALPSAPASIPEKSATSVLPVQVASAPQRSAVKVRSAKSQTARAATTVASRQFLALPGYDPAVPPDQLHVVRVQLPASALWQIGAPISADAGPQRMTADFVVSQDGTPYAVRLVQ
ncbi:MAG: hypothetical protein WA738_15625 [Candidatus Angelobacter sp.]